MTMARIGLPAVILLFSTLVHAQYQDTFNVGAFGYNLQTNVIYGKGKISPDGRITERDLLLDIYSPSEHSSDKPLPAVVLVHGGAFHRGGLRQPPYKEAGAVHSGMEDYARLLTPYGYVCFVVDYRLTQEFPEPGVSLDADWLQPMEEGITDAGLKRSNFARAAMDLPPLKADEKIVLWKAMISAAEDVKKAVQFIQTNADRYGVDPNRVALGGHSAGATTVLNVGYGLNAPISAMFPLSPAVAGLDIKKTVTSPSLPPTLYVISQNDEPAISEGVPALVSQMASAGMEYELVWVPGFPHFYPTGAVSLGDDGTRMSVGDRVIKFLDEHL